MSDVICPYCGKDQEICHDDGYGYDEGITHRQECEFCEKVFTYQTTIIFHYDVSKADCLNKAGEHQFKKVVHFPEYWPNWVKCKNCGKEDRGNRVI